MLEYLRDVANRPRRELTRRENQLRYAGELVVHCGRQLQRHRAEGMAAELTYRTIFALIPVVVLGLVLFRVVGGLDDVRSRVENQLYSFFGVPEVPADYGGGGDAAAFEFFGGGDDPADDAANDSGETDSGDTDSGDTDSGDTDSVPNHPGRATAKGQPVGHGKSIRRPPRTCPPKGTGRASPKGTGRPTPKGRGRARPKRKGRARPRGTGSPTTGRPERVSGGRCDKPRTR